MHGRRQPAQTCKTLDCKGLFVMLHVVFHLYISVDVAVRSEHCLCFFTWRWAVAVKTVHCCCQFLLGIVCYICFHVFCCFAGSKLCKQGGCDKGFASSRASPLASGGWGWGQGVVCGSFQACLRKIRSVATQNTAAAAGPLPGCCPAAAGCVGRICGSALTPAPSPKATSPR